MTQVIRSNKRHYADHGWLQANWHFSFGDYNDPDNVHFGPLRVFNDDVVQPGQGFGMHPHKDMEIITYVIDGQVEHKDHLGNRAVIHPGELQVMSAGRGIMHSEYNPSKEAPAHLLQLWVIPRTRNLPPRWAQKQFTAADRAGRLLPVVTPTTDGTPGDSGVDAKALTIDQDATIYVSSLAAGQEVVHETKPGRLTYAFVIDGALDINGDELSLAKGDQARIGDVPKLTITAPQDAELILLDLPTLN